MFKTDQQIAVMREGGKLLAEILGNLLSSIEVGMSTDDCDAFFHNALRDTEAEPVFLGYRGFPKTICTSINDEVVHGIPSVKRFLHAGDIIGVDCGLRYRGWCLDMSRTIGVGALIPEAQRLLDVTLVAQKAGIAATVVGNTIGDIGACVQEIVEKAGFSVVRALVGHGVGKNLHEDPPVPNYGKRGTGMKLGIGMVLAIEPMVNIGKSNILVDADGWTVRTADGKLSAHFEDTIAITKNGSFILTQ